MKKLKKYILYLIISTFIILVCSKSTSPLYDGTYTIDSSVFRVIGNGLIQGYCPYKDLFDHKGPILFFIQAIGIIINKEIGIFILQIINCFVVIIFLEKLINIFEKGKIKSKITLGITLIFYLIVFGEGNFSEEWSLSFITIALYIIFKDFFCKEFSKKTYICLGAIFAVLSLIRLNNAASIIGFCIYQFFYLIINKKYKKLLEFIILFLVGLIIVYLPIILIFIKWNALYEMLYATFIFNFAYGFKYSYSILMKILGIIPLIILLFFIKISDIKINLKRCLYSIILSNAICVCVGYAYLHYYIILVPLISILIIQFETYVKNIDIHLKKNIIYISVIAILFSGWIEFWNINRNWDKQNYKRQAIILEDAKELEKYIKNKKSVLCFDIPANIYLILNITPSYKYFTGQSWHILHDKNIGIEIKEHIENNNIRYIITYNDTQLDILNKYQLIFQNNSFLLYEKI